VLYEEFGELDVEEEIQKLKKDDLEAMLRLQAQEATRRAKKGKRKGK
jgi:hypothetical protein